MKILVLTESKEFSIVKFIADHNQSTDFVIAEFRDNINISEFDSVFIFGGSFDKEVTDSNLKAVLPIEMFRLLKRKQAKLLIEHHYNASYNKITVPFRVVSRALIFNVYPAFKILSNYTVCSNSSLDASKNFLYGVRNQAVCFIAHEEPPNEIYETMPVIPLAKGIKSNIDMESFFGNQCIDMDFLKEVGETFWRLQYYHIWGSFNDTFR
tara:strand:- start:1444 stop:2073 length:630 start_codon:yes stop_codon:yes gene_type:complete